MSQAIKELVERRAKLEKDIREAVSKLVGDFKQETTVSVMGVNIDIMDVSTMGKDAFITTNCFVKLRI